MTLAAPLPKQAEPGHIRDLDPPWPVELLWQSGSDESDRKVRGGLLPADLASRYAAPLSIPLRTDRPTIVANFVSTLDGVVALDRIGASGGHEISGGFEPDRFVMGLLRATADALLVGAGTVRASRTHGWTPGHAHPASVNAFARWRRQLGLTASPPTVIVSASGSLQPGHLPEDPRAPVIVVTTKPGARRLGELPRLDHVEIVSVGGGASIPVGTLVAFLDARGFRLVVSEGGPSLFGELLASSAVDELFLTVAPHLAGRDASSARLSLVEDVALTPGAPWWRLRSVLRSNDHLFLRYQRSHPRSEDVP